MSPDDDNPLARGDDADDAARRSKRHSAHAARLNELSEAGIDLAPVVGGQVIGSIAPEVIESFSFVEQAAPSPPPPEPLRAAEEPKIAPSIAPAEIALGYEDEDPGEHLRDELARAAKLLAAGAGYWAAWRGFLPVDEQSAGIQVVPRLEAIPEEVTQSLRDAWEEARAERHAIHRRLSQTDHRLRRHLPVRTLLRAFHFDPHSLEAEMIALAGAPQFVPSIRGLLETAEVDCTGGRPTVEFLRELLRVGWSGETQDFATQFDRSLHRLIEEGIVELVAASTLDPMDPFPQRGVALGEGVLQHLNGAQELDPQLTAVATMHGEADDFAASMHHSVEAKRLDDKAESLIARVSCRETHDAGLILMLVGEERSGRLALARRLARRRERPLLEINTRRAMQECPDWEALLRSVSRFARLRNCLVFWSEVDLLLAADQPPDRWTMLLRRMGELPSLVFLASTTPWEPRGEFRDEPIYRLDVVLPGYEERRQIWRDLLARVSLAGPLDRDATAAILAGSFQLSREQILDALSDATRRAELANETKLSLENLQDGCRVQAGRRLQRWARRIVPEFDLPLERVVLPLPGKLRLERLLDRINLQHRVSETTVGRRGQTTGGPVALFAGPSGTGKTLAAECLASKAKRDLYKIDLAAIVSKWVGETEQNLARVFAEAEDSNAILFFDEADSLFSKRGEVREARDRWANLETNYLLQRIDDYGGPVILATNFRQNLDEAFLRRIHLVVEFPFPDASARGKILERLLAERSAQTSPEALRVLADRFALSGGSLRNIVLDAVCQRLKSGEEEEEREPARYASSGACATLTKPAREKSSEIEISVRQLVVAIAIEYEKLGKTVSRGEFGERFFGWYQEDVLGLVRTE